MYGLFYGVNSDGLRCPENDVSDLASLYRSKGGNVILIRGNKINKYVLINILKKIMCRFYRIIYIHLFLINFIFELMTLILRHVKY